MFSLAFILSVLVSQASPDAVQALELSDEYPAYARGETVFIGEGRQEVVGSCFIASSELMGGVGAPHPDAAQLQTLVEFWWQVAEAEIPDLAENTELPLAADYWLRWHYESDHAVNTAWLLSIVEACAAQEVAAMHGGMPAFAPSPLIAVHASPIERSTAACLAIAADYDAFDHSDPAAEATAADRLAWWTGRAVAQNIAESELVDARERLFGDASANRGIMAAVQSSARLNMCDDQQAVYLAYNASLDSDAPVEGQ